MSDLLEAAAAALGTPAPLVRRSAAARAAETGVSMDEILTAWAGGAPVAAAPAPAPEASADTAPEPVAAEPASPPPAPEPATESFPVFEPAAVAVMEAEPEVDLEPVPMGVRVRTAVRIGAWIGA